jgi:transcriptional regulator with XRE-family HTH domain
MAIDQKLLGQGIRKIRKLRGMTQSELAQAAGLAESGNSLALIERGERGVSIDSLNALARALEVPAGCLTILGTRAPANDPALRPLISSLHRLVAKVVELHSVLKKEDAEKTAKKKMKRKKPTRRSTGLSSRKKHSAA